ncbi:MAG TPA: hypothetical protein VIS07_10115 [Candidatus Binatia bacterium]
MSVATRRLLALVGTALALAVASPSAAVDLLATSCPCSGPAVGGRWRDNDHYLACVAHAARAGKRRTDVRVTSTAREPSDAQSSSCGRTRPIEGNVRVCGPNPVLPCPTVRTARVDSCEECDVALAGRLVRCARVARMNGGTADVCGTTATGRIIAGRAIDVRTGVDCASCKAKLGTPRPAGLDCVVAACQVAF